MNKYGKNITIMLTLGSYLLSMASCQNKISTTVTNVGTTSENTQSLATNDSSSIGFDKTDYNGATFNVLAPDWGLYANYFFADEQTGDVMNDSIYNRELYVEDYLGIDATYKIEGSIDDIMSKIQNSVMASDDAYQLVLTHCISNVSATMTSGLLYDWNDLKYCNFDKDHWNHNCNEALSINGHQYYAISDYMLPDPNCILFNKDILTSLKLDNPYDLVRSGEWTLDKMIEMASAATKDLDGNSEFDFNDQYGLSCDNNWRWNSFIYSSGLSLVGKNNSGELELSINNDRMVSLVEKLYKFINESGDVNLWNFDASDDEKLLISTGRVLFQVETLNYLNYYRDTNVEFGILPYPKYDTNQANYMNNDWSGLMCIPITVSNPDMVSKALELFAYYSATTTIPAYYDLVLGEKLSRDEDSKEMLEIIYDNIVFDVGLNYLGFNKNMERLFFTITYLVIQKNSGDFASWYAQYGSGSEAEIDALMTATEIIN